MNKLCQQNTVNTDFINTSQLGTSTNVSNRTVKWNSELFFPKWSPVPLSSGKWIEHLTTIARVDSAAPHYLQYIWKKNLRGMPLVLMTNERRCGSDQWFFGWPVEPGSITAGQVRTCSLIWCFSLSDTCS